jgi:hypothetical protein
LLDSVQVLCRILSRRDTETISQNEGSLFHLELVTSMDVTSRETEISNILDALTLGMQPAISEGAEQAACQLDFECPPLERNKEASGYLWNIWEVMGNIAGSPSATPEIQKRLVAVLKCLQKCAKGDLRTWSVSRLVHQSNYQYCYTFLCAISRGVGSVYGQTCLYLLRLCIHFSMVCIFPK